MVGLGRVVLSTYIPLTEFSEARYAEIARQILVTGDWVTLWFHPELPFWGKPPIVFWSTALSFLIFGVNETAARLPSLLFIMATAWLIYTWLQDLVETSRARLGACAFLSCWLILQLGGSVVLDAALVFCVTLVLKQFWYATIPRDASSTQKRSRAVWVMWLGLGLGLLTKGPIIPVLCGLTALAWWMANRQFNNISQLRPLSGPLLMLAIAAPWYLTSEVRTPGFIDYFLVGEHLSRYLEEGWAGVLFRLLQRRSLGR
ncbi:MAG: phospholipid carrier-dependent glycosyltransferase [Pseudomonadota bacterium]